jgi:hypothetical protein
MYAAKSGNTLSSVTRGFQGTARTWPISSKIARNFTAYDYDTIRTMLDEGQTIPAPINRGVNVIQSDQASGATFNVRGCTLCNILGRDGGCESLAPFISSGAGTDELSSFEGIKSFKFTTSNAARVRYKDYGYTLDSSKYYIVGCWAYVESYTTGSPVTLSLRDSATNTSRYAANVNTALVGQKQFIYAKVPLSNSLGTGFRLLFGANGIGTMTVHFGAIRLYEVSAADYAAIGATITGAAIDDRWPYVDSVQHTRGLSVLMPGKNLLPPSSQTYAINSEWTPIAQYTAVLKRTTSGQEIAFQVRSKPNQVYTVGFQGGLRVAVLSVSSAGTASTVLAYNDSNPRTFTTPADSVYLRIYFASASNGDYTLSDWMLVLGGADQLPASFMPYNPSYANADTTLASNVDRSIADSYDSATGQVFRRWRTGFKLDGSLAWAFGIDQTGFKTIISTGWVAANGALPAITMQSAVRHDGAIIKASSYAELSTIPEAINIGSTALHLNVSDAYSGWTESLNPNGNAAKALMNGWRANGNNGSVYNSWVSILTGAAPTTNTEAYVAANKAPGWDAYATLDYVRATPITETLTGDLGGLAMVKGGNTVELLEGVIVREKANPVASIGLYGINRFTETSKLGYRADRIIAIYKGGVKDDKWTFGAHTSQTSVYGNQWATIPTADYDPAAEYFVDYITLDKYAYTANAVDATLVYRSTLGGAVAQATQDIARLTAQMGVHEWKLLLDEAYAANIRRDFDAHAGAGGAAHALATTGTAGFMSAADKAAVDTIADQMRTISMGGMV